MARWQGIWGTQARMGIISFGTINITEVRYKEQVGYIEGRLGEPRKQSKTLRPLPVKENQNDYVKIGL